jgi:hypothetical protein
MIAAIPEGGTEQNDIYCRVDRNNDDGPGVHGCIQYGENGMNCGRRTDPLIQQFKYAGYQ